jgi:hypothetical protein
MAEDPPTWKQLARFEGDYPELASAIEPFMRDSSSSFMDVLGFYIKWRESGKRPNSFLNRQLRDWGIQSWIGEYPPATLKRMIASADITLQLNDEATISAALSQQIYDRKIVTADRKKALVCIARQQSDILLRHRGYPNFEEATREFDSLRKVIEANL